MGVAGSVDSGDDDDDDDENEVDTFLIVVYVSVWFYRGYGLKDFGLREILKKV